MSIAGSVVVIAATIRKSVACLVTVTPIWRTCSGRRGSASATRFWISTWAVSMSVPGWKVTVIEVRPWLMFERM